MNPQIIENCNFKKGKGQEINVVIKIKGIICR